MRRIVIVAVPPANELDVVGPLAVFAQANVILRARGHEPAYATEIVSAGARHVPGSSGLTFVADRVYRDVRGSVDTLLVAGGPGVRAGNDEAFLTWLRRRAPTVRRLGSVCTGAFALAEAGLLDGRRATTHWAYAEDLARRYPAIAVDVDPIWVRDGSVVTSAGVTAGIDLSLALVADDEGTSVALAVARELVVFVQRPGGQSQHSVPLAGQRAEGREFRELTLWITRNVDKDLRVVALAERMAMSERTFVRRFAQQLGTPPARYVELARVEAARRRLEETDETAEAVAAECGYRSAEVMRRAFLRHVGMTPGQYRHRVATTARDAFT